MKSCCACSPEGKRSRVCGAAANDTALYVGKYEEFCLDRPTTLASPTRDTRSPIGWSITLIGLSYNEGRSGPIAMPPVDATCLKYLLLTNLQQCDRLGTG